MSPPFKVIKPKIPEPAPLSKPNMFKTCSKCLAAKPLSEFNNDKAAKDGLRYNCSDCHRKYNRKAYFSLSDEKKSAKLAKCSQWCALNRDRINAVRRKRTLSPQARKRRSASRRLNHLINGASPGKFDNLVGCTGDEFKAHLKSKFKPGMTWENHGEWHIDHIIPLSAFDPFDPEQWVKANHHSNVQALWAIENMKKGNKILSPHLNDNRR